MVGDAQGSTPFRVGIQTSSPGYRTPLHSHPYMEALTILEGEGEAWIGSRSVSGEARNDAGVPGPHAPLVRALGTRPLKTCGVHGSPHRIVIEHADDGKSYW